MTENQARIMVMASVGVDCYSLSEKDMDTLFYLSKDLGYCDTRELSDTIYRLTPKGEAALAAFIKEREQETKDERQRRFQNQISVAQVLVPAVTFVLGLIVEFRTGIIGAILQLFR